MRSLAIEISSARPVPVEDGCRAMDTKPVVLARRCRRRRGSSLVELTLIAPWLLFLFVGVVDVGFYTYSLIAVENAARIAAEYTSKNLALAGNSDAACTKARLELEMLPGVGSLANCSNSTLTVTAASVNGPDLKPATSVSVTYQGRHPDSDSRPADGKTWFYAQCQMRVKP